MAEAQRLRVEPSAIHARALDELRFIRRTMENAGSFTAVSGLAGVAMGLIAGIAALLASSRPTPGAWISTWIVAAALGFAVGTAGMIFKAKRAGVPLLRGPGLRFLLGLSPPLVVGALLTLVLFQRGVTDLLPGTWLTLYGTGIVTGGAHSVRVVPVMGLGLMILGAAALLGPAGWGDTILALGLGGGQIVGGFVIARRHGG